MASRSCRRIMMHLLASFAFAVFVVFAAMAMFWYASKWLPNVTP